MWSTFKEMNGNTRVSAGPRLFLINVGARKKIPSSWDISESRNGVVGVVTTLRVGRTGVLFPSGVRYFLLQKRPNQLCGTILACYAVGIHVLSPRVNSRDLKLATDFHLLPRSGALVPQLPFTGSRQWEGQLLTSLWEVSQIVVYLPLYV